MCWPAKSSAIIRPKKKDIREERERREKTLTSYFLIGVLLPVLVLAVHKDLQHIFMLNSKPKGSEKDEETKVEVYRDKCREREREGARVNEEDTQTERQAVRQRQRDE